MSPLLNSSDSLLALINTTTEKKIPYFNYSIYTQSVYSISNQKRDLTDSVLIIIVVVKQQQRKTAWYIVIWGGFCSARVFPGSSSIRTHSILNASPSPWAFMALQQHFGKKDSKPLGWWVHESLNFLSCHTHLNNLDETHAFVS